MSPKKNASSWNIKRLFSAVMCLLIALMFFVSQFLHGFSIVKIVFGVIILYFSIAFFRTAKE